MASWPDKEIIGQTPEGKEKPWQPGQRLEWKTGRADEARGLQIAFFGEGQGRAFADDEMVQNTDIHQVQGRF